MKSFKQFIVEEESLASRTKKLAHHIAKFAHHEDKHAISDYNDERKGETSSTTIKHHKAMEKHNKAAHKLVGAKHKKDFHLGAYDTSKKNQKHLAAHLVHKERAK